MRTREVTCFRTSAGNVPSAMSKPAKTYQEQLDLLKRRGLRVPDEPFALHILEHHNYYRLSAYRFPFCDHSDRDRFLPGTTFNQIWDLYHFDRRLRQLIMEATKRVEISARSRWAYEIGHRLGPLAYLENAHFSDPLIHARTLAKLDSEMSRSGKEEFIKHHKSTLGTPWPPAWVVTEVATFGNTSNLIGQLKEPSLRQAIADTYQLDEKTFCSILHHFTVLRNTAAHHSRIWNRKFVVKFQLPKKKPAHLYPNFVKNSNGYKQRKIYNSLVLLIHFVTIIEPDTGWPQRLLNTLGEFDPQLLPEMGFPTDWKRRPLWHALLNSKP